MIYATAPDCKMYPRTFSKLPSVQVESEFNLFLDLIKERKVSSYLEIGTARGDTFHEIVGNMPVASKALAVDYPMQSWGLEKSNQHLYKVENNLKLRSYDVQVLFGNSQDKEIIKKVEEFAPFDLVFIDGDHTYKGVESDWENYGHLGRMVAFHDIADTMRPNLKNEIIEVPRFWNDIKNSYKHVEFIETGSTMGIGVIFLD